MSRQSSATSPTSGPADASNPSQVTPPPKFVLTLAPRTSAGEVTGVHIAYTIQEPKMSAGETVCRLPQTIVGIPGALLTSRDLHVTDAEGKLPVAEEQEPQNDIATFRRWVASRDSLGDVSVSYFAPVRSVDHTTPNGPLFDLRAEASGLTGAGITFLALPDGEDRYDVTIDWDLSEMPTGSRAVSNLGEGRVRTEATMHTIAFSFFLAGPLRVHPEGRPEPFAIYWLSDPPFDPVAVAERTERIYAVMCDFFREPEPGYRVFIRKNPHRGNGGTALPRSFMFGHGDGEPPTIESLWWLLSHETAHNWPRLAGEHRDTAWYGEGTAEYYSITLSHRGGLIEAAEYLRQLNERTRAYYTNPLHTLSNEEAAKRFWHDPRAQKIPYGRGLLYLINTNAKIAAASEGQRSLDNLVLAVLERQRGGEDPGITEWLELVTNELGDSARDDFDAMCAGQPIIPASNALGKLFVGQPIDDQLLDLGFDVRSLRDRVIRGLASGSAADDAGIREGDRILDAPDFHEILNATGVISIVIERERPTKISYVPRGEPTISYQWQAVDGPSNHPADLFG